MPDAKSIYFSLLESEAGPTASGLQGSRIFLQRQLAQAAELPCDLPDEEFLGEWIIEQATAVGRQYREYLDQRQAGAPRRYFSNKSHALYFLRSAAPTKLVDGAWLYGLLEHWNDARYAPLIRIYLDELGEGESEKNHVALYRNLLASHGCDQWHDLDADYFTQGAIQLALAHHTAEFLPEVIGFNLGYEQLPLHLLITAYELNELGIDPYYFTLHITVDNAATGHARKAVQAVIDAMPRHDRAAFFQRVKNGYQLNELGTGTTAIIASFDLEQALLSVFKSKAALGALMHSDYCRIDGKTVTEWLVDPGQLPAFLASLEKMGWIKRNQDPELSRFWKLIHGERAAMFGVFSPYEQQLIHDWIAGEWTEQARAGTRKPLTFNARRRLLETLGSNNGKAQDNHTAPEVTNARPSSRQNVLHYRSDSDNDEFHTESHMLEKQLDVTRSKAEAMNVLAGYMSPSQHHTAIGMLATRKFAQLFN